MEKERRTKALVLSTLVVVVATLSIAFAAMSQVLNINGIGKMDTASWSVYFDNLSEANIVRGAEEVGKPKISDDKGIVQDINVQLSNPKDEISYTVDIVNDGTIDAEITMIKDIELTDAQKKVFEFKVTYTDTGEVLQNGDILPKDTIRNITITIRFKDDITEFDLPTENQVINLSYQLTYTQYDGGNGEIGPDGELDGPKYIMANKWYGDSQSYASAETITFLNNINVPYSEQVVTWDASEAGDNSVVGYYTDADSNGLYEVYIGAIGKVYAPEDSSMLFRQMLNLKEINFNNNFDVSLATTFEEMFYNCSKLKNLDLSNWNASKVTNISNMFNFCSSLTNVSFENANFSSVTSMNNLFCYLESLKTVNLSGMNVSSVTDVSSTFYMCSELTSVNLSGMYASNVTNLQSIFDSCKLLNDVDFSNSDFSSTIDLSNFFAPSYHKNSLTTVNMIETIFADEVDMTDMFAGSGSIKNVYIDIYSSANLTGMFRDCGITTINVNLKITENADMSSMFSNCSSLTSLDLRGLNISKVTNMEGMFSGCSSLTSLDLSSFDTSNVTNMGYMFSGCSSLANLNFGNFDTSNVPNMSQMFYGCSSLTSLDLSSFDTSNVTNMGYMFSGCSSLANLNFGNFDTSNVTNMSNMFSYCSGLINLNLSSFNTTKVTDMTNIFLGCTTLKTLNLSGWDVSGLTSLSNFFKDLSSLETLKLTNFKTSSITDMSKMFSGCSSLTSLDLSSFDTKSVTTMYAMFNGCSSLTYLNIDGFDFSQASLGLFVSNCSKLTTISANNIQSPKTINNLRYIFNAKSSLEYISFKNLKISDGLTTLANLFKDFTKLKKVDMQGANISTVTNTSTMFSGCTSLNEVIIDGFDLSKVTTKTNMFLNVPEFFTIYVKDETAKNFILGLRSDANVIIGAPSA